MKKTKILQKAICILLAVLILSVVFDFTGFFWGDDVYIAVENGESFSSVVDKMTEEGVITYGFLFGRYAISKKADVALKSGEHLMRKNMGYKEAAGELVKNADSDGTVILTVPEGYEIKDIERLLYEKFGISKEEFSKALGKNYGTEFEKNIPEREKRLEGYLFPETYEFYATDGAETIIKKMLSGFENMWTEEYDRRCEELSMSADEIIILASIIEREAGSTSEMAEVSSVFHNRLNIGMALQSCATVQYILPERKDVLSIYDTKIDSPYNTYLYPGLPEGPVSNPGRAAIEAALYPAATDYYYFKVNDSGETVFSKTLSEHNAK